MITKISTKNINQLPKQNNNTTSFKGPGAAALNGLNFLATNQGLGACAVDFCSMVTPRTLIDFKKRGTQAGIETGIREGTSCFIHAAIGVIGTAIGAAISRGFNKAFGIKAHNIYANSETIDYCADVWRATKTKKEYFRSILSQMQGLDGQVWKKIPEEVIEDVSESLSHAKENKTIVKEAVAKISQAIGAQGNFRIGNGKSVISDSADIILDNARSLGEAFKKVDVNETELFNGFIKKLKSTKLKTTLVGMGLCAILCMSVQPINRYLTKKRTGQDGFVGVQGASADNSKEFKAKKTAIGLGMLAAMHASIGKPKNYIKNIQFNSKFPSINQFKFLYGATIASRILSARDKNELREGVIKDSLGFTNWLILGGFVSRLAARAMGKDLINNPVIAENGKKGLKYAFQWLTKSSVKNFNEILMPAAKEITKDGRLMNVGELFKVADKATKSKVMKAAGAQILGYLYSGLVLGVGIARLNIAITNRVKNNERAKELAKNPITVRVNKTITQTNDTPPLTFAMSNKISKFQ